MAIGDAMVAPTGVQNQMVGQPSRVPGYSQGLGQAPGQMALPPEPMPIGRPTAVVGGPAYFTPQGYNAPPQPTQAFMPTDRAPDPIGQQFMRQMQSPMGQQFQQQYEATQAPIREAEMAQRAEAQAAQDARFQEMMDRIAELEGQVPGPTEPTAPMPGDVDPYIPGGPFPGIPDFSNLDFSNLPDFSNFDYDDIMRRYNDRMEMGEPEPMESFLPGPRDNPQASTMPLPSFSMPELPDFSNIPTPESRSELSSTPTGGFMSGSGMGRIGQGVATDREGLMGATLFGQKITPESFAGRETAKSPFLRATPRPETVFGRDFSNIPGLQTGPILKSKGLGRYSLDESDLQRAIAEMGAVRKEVPMQTPTMGMPAPAPQAPIPMTLPNYTPNIPNIDFSNLPKPGRMPKMDFSNLRNINLT